MSIRIDVSRLYDIADKISDNIVSDIAQEIGSNLQDLLERKSPRVTGELASSWQLTSQGDTVIVENDTPQARFVVDGTRPHVILPVNANALSFYVNGTHVFAKRVNHPGTAPNPFVDEAVSEVEYDIEMIVERKLREAGIL